MLKKLTCQLLLTSAILLPISQQAFAANNNTKTTPSAMEISDKININKATNEELAAIKGLGNKKAQAIIDYRQGNGDFVSLEELIKVKGIGNSTLKKIAPFISL